VLIEEISAHVLAHVLAHGSVKAENESNAFCLTGLQRLGPVDS